MSHTCKNCAASEIAESARADDRAWGEMCRFAHVEGLAGLRLLGVLRQAGINPFALRTRLADAERERDICKGNRTRLEQTITANAVLAERKACARIADLWEGFRGDEIAREIRDRIPATEAEPGA